MKRNLTIPGPRFSFYLILANACQLYGLGDDLAYRYLREAYETGTPAVDLRKSLLARLSQLSVNLGHKEFARKLMAEFLSEFPRDNRANTLHLQFKELASSE